MVLQGWESVFFWVFAIAALVAALLTILAQNAVHSALFLISTLVSVAALYILLGAEFIAGVQILVYVGGVMVLFLFVIMLVNVSAEERGREELFNRPGQVGAALVFAALLVFGLIYAINTSASVSPGALPGGWKWTPARLMTETRLMPRTAATMMLAKICFCPLKSSSRPRSSALTLTSMMTNRNRTITPPT